MHFGPAVEELAAQNMAMQGPVHDCTSVDQITVFIFYDIDFTLSLYISDSRIRSSTHMHLLVDEQYPEVLRIDK